MNTESETGLIEQNVAYTLEKGGKLFVVENVPARVHPETGEQFFAPETVETLQKLLRLAPKHKSQSA